MTARSTQWKAWMGIAIALAEDGMTQQELADELGWTEAHVSRTVNGKRRIYFDEILEIARVQNRPVSWYIDGFGDTDAVLANPGYAKRLIEMGVIPHNIGVLAGLAPTG